MSEPKAVPVNESKPSTQELSPEELNQVVGGEVTFNYGGTQVTYTQQKPDGKP
jgi:hypothetical protein